MRVRGRLDGVNGGEGEYRITSIVNSDSDAGSISYVGQVLCKLDSNK